MISLCILRYTCQSVLLLRPIYNSFDATAIDDLIVSTIIWVPGLYFSPANPTMQAVRYFSLHPFQTSLAFQFVFRWLYAVQLEYRSLDFVFV
jgi:hypothetical protein